MEDFTGIRKRVYDVAMNLYHSGLIRLSAGNVSARVNEELIAITPSGRPYTILQPEDTCLRICSVTSCNGTLKTDDAVCA